MGPGLASTKLFLVQVEVSIMKLFKSKRTFRSLTVSSPNTALILRAIFSVFVQRRNPYSKFTYSDFLSIRLFCLVISSSYLKWHTEPKRGHLRYGWTTSSKSLNRSLRKISKLKWQAISAAELFTVGVNGFLSGDCVSANVVRDAHRLGGVMTFRAKYWTRWRCRSTPFSARALTRMIASTMGAPLAEAVLVVRQIQPYPKEIFDEAPRKHIFKELAYLVKPHYRPAVGW